ncbi:MAG: RNA pyrophosphohydrolase [Campylobacterales bacterium]
MAQTTKRYRPNVAAIILSPRYPERVEIFIGERSDIKDAWQFPQGGVDENESAREALLRELKEEIGTDNVEILAEYPTWLTYDFPETVAAKMYPFDGQKQKYFLVRLKPGATIDIRTQTPEFAEFKFVEVSELFKFISHFKRPIYKKVLGYFQKNGYL